MHIAEVRQAASTKPPQDWGRDTGELLKRLPPPKEDSTLSADTIPSLQLKGRINKRITKHVGDIMHDLDDTDDKLLTKLLSYSRKVLPVNQELCGDFEKMRKFPAERFNRLEIPVPKFQQANMYTPHIIRCTMKSNYGNHGPWKDCVSIMAGAKDQFGALQSRLPAILRYLFKLRDPYSGTTMRLALVQLLQAQPGAGHLQDDSDLVKVSRRLYSDSRDERVVGINSILRIAHLVPDIDIPGQYRVMLDPDF